MAFQCFTFWLLLKGKGVKSHLRMSPNPHLEIGLHTLRRYCACSRK